MNETVRALGRRLGLRRMVEDGLDHLRYRIDRLSDPIYQHHPALGEDGGIAVRAAGTASRWAAMIPILDEIEPRSALDIGCNSGWFVIALAARGSPCVGVEYYPPARRTAIYAARKSAHRDAIGILSMRVDEATVGLLPGAECVLFLSVWHHIVRDRGLNAASRILTAIWERTGAVLFFETGEAEMPPSFGLPAMTPDARAWLAAYLAQRCPGGDVQHLGRHYAGQDPSGVVHRNLFAVRRTPPQDRRG